MENVVFLKNCSSFDERELDQVSTASSIYNKLKNNKTDIGFKASELKEMTNEELFNLKHSVTSYLNSSQKYKYEGYLSLFKRIVRELYSRKIVFEMTKVDKKKEKLLGRKRDVDTQKSDEALDTQNSTEKATSKSKKSKVRSTRRLQPISFTKLYFNSIRVPNLFNDLEIRRGKLPKFENTSSIEVGKASFANSTNCLCDIYGLSHNSFCSVYPNETTSKSNDDHHTSKNRKMQNTSSLNSPNKIIKSSYDDNDDHLSDTDKVSPAIFNSNYKGN